MSLLSVAASQYMYLARGGSADHVVSYLAWLVESPSGALGVAQCPYPHQVEEVRGGPRAVLAAPASHHHLALLVLLGGGGQADWSDGLTE